MPEVKKLGPTVPQIDSGASASPQSGKVSAGSGQRQAAAQVAQTSSTGIQTTVSNPSVSLSTVASMASSSQSVLIAGGSTINSAADLQTQLYELQIAFDMQKREIATLKRENVERRLTENMLQLDKENLQRQNTELRSAMESLSDERNEFLEEIYTLRDDLEAIEGIYRKTEKAREEIEAKFEALQREVMMEGKMKKQPGQM